MKKPKTKTMEECLVTWKGVSGPVIGSDSAKDAAEMHLCRLVGREDPPQPGDIVRVDREGKESSMWKVNPESQWGRQGRPGSYSLVPTVSSIPADIANVREATQ